VKPGIAHMGAYTIRGANYPFLHLDNPNIDGAPLVFLVKRDTGKWLQVYLPTRPNGSTGWIKRSRVKLTGHSYRVQIDLTNHRLTAWNGARAILHTNVGVGRAVTPTPAGLYYITELLKQPDPTGAYGPWAFGLSAHSDVLHEFAGRDGILGLHGTNYPQGIGTDVSHGCIRMSNAAITKLAHTLPVGTPVRIVRV
jgi:lipoprotein-anchoring transpeptidase ErfK/SrfK